MIAAAIGLGDVLEIEEVVGTVIGDAERVERSRLGPLGTDLGLLRRYTIQRLRVLAHEAFRPGRAGQVDGESILAESDANLPVVVGIKAAILRQTVFASAHGRHPRSKPHPTDSSALHLPSRHSE